MSIRVQPNGSKSWVVRGTTRGKAIRLTLGSAKSINVITARRLAREALTAKLHPNTPESNTLKLRDFEVIYRENHVTKWKPSSQRPYRSRMLNNILPAFGETPIGLITNVDVSRWFHRLSRKAPGNANESLIELQILLNAAKLRGNLPDGHVNPCLKIKKNRKNARGQAINSDAIIRLGKAFKKLRPRFPDAIDLLHLLVLTGCRLGEIMTLRWSYVLPDRLELPDSKSGNRTIPLGIEARRVLHNRGLSSYSPVVFPSRDNKNKPRVDLWYAWKIVRSEAALPENLRIHDLRHTYASHSVGSGESLLITGQLLGHRDQESTTRYAHLFDHAVLASCERIANAIYGWSMGRIAPGMPFGRSMD